MIRSVLRVLAVMTVLFGAFFLLKDLYEKRLADHVIGFQTLLKALEEPSWIASGDVRVTGPQASWSVSLSDTTLVRRMPFLYNVATTAMIEKDAARATSRAEVGFILNYGNLYVNPLKVDPFSEVFLLPPAKGWSSFAGSQDYAKLFFDRYVPIPFRDRIEKRGEDLFHVLSLQNPFASAFRFTPKRWIRELLHKPFSAQFHIDPASSFVLIEDWYRELEKKELSDEARENLKRGLENVQNLAWTVETTEEGTLSALHIFGEWREGVEIDVRMNMQRGAEEMKIISPRPFVHYQDLINTLTPPPPFMEGEPPDFSKAFAFRSFSEDADKDGLVDAVETFFATDPEKQDTDDDGFTDYEELSQGFSPYKANTRLYD